MMKKNNAMSRSENMARIKHKDTKPELYIRKLLWRAGFRYKLHSKSLPGKPDLYFPKYKAVIFVNGCFWHLHENCRFAAFPKTNNNFWKKKLLSNSERDKKTYLELEEMDIRVFLVWGCEIKQMKKDENYRDLLLAKIKSFIINIDRKET